jgi:aspartyl-tRNA(Asn)/glutamyl-tRNA(Gln) amidotransferase subunit C
MALTLEDVKRIAHLARIELDGYPGAEDREAGGYLGQINGILGLIEEMQAVDTRGIEPMSHAQDLVQRLRPDVATEADQHELFQSVAPAVEMGLYLVPKVIE